MFPAALPMMLFAHYSHNRICGVLQVPFHSVTVEVL